ncbi:MAG: hypothetical protein HYR48_02175, partial [Gemmatimonadetes bacterium]|nr:hypothetical protein [Gemmatimonadota bacterium]
MISSLIAAAVAASHALVARPVAPDVSAAHQLSSAGDTLRAGAAATAIRAVPAAPRLDGRLDEPAWALA